MWTCPYCKERIRLTWIRYFSEPGSTHRCPRCKNVSVVNTPSWLWGARIAGLLVGGVPLAILFLKGGPEASFGGLVVGALTTGIPIDKFLDGHCRRLIRIGLEEKT